MKTSLLLLAGLLIVSSLSSAKVVGNSGNFLINSNDEVLTFQVNTKVREPLAAWWEENGFFGNRTLVENMGTFSMGDNLPSIAPKEIYVIAPYSTKDRIKVEMNITPIKVEHSSGAPFITIPLKLKDKSGYQDGQSLSLDPDSSGGASGDGKAVIAAVDATGLTGLDSYIGGDIIEVISDTHGIAVPLKSGNYSGSSKITVKLRP